MIVVLNDDNGIKIGGSLIRIISCIWEKKPENLVNEQDLDILNSRNCKYKGDTGTQRVGIFTTIGRKLDVAGDMVATEYYGSGANLSNRA